MAPKEEQSSSSIRRSTSSEDVSRILLIRHGDRFDYANPSWLVKAAQHGTLVTDPPLSPLGHKQAQETAEHLVSLLKERSSSSSSSSSSEVVAKILVSPYLRVLQTACPLSDALNVPLSIETGLSEAHATPGVLPTTTARFSYFPQVDPSYESLLEVEPTPGFTCPKTGHPCEAFAGRYVQRMERFARALEEAHDGETVVCYSHAASTALVAALLKCSMRDLKFAPCGIFELTRSAGKPERPWTLVTNGAVNESHVSQNSPTTYPWGFGEKHFQEKTTAARVPGGDYFGSSERIGLEYFVQKNQRDD
eukprot:scaffold34681_cov154-Amphora_coffeaeformis.AAC.2